MKNNVRLLISLFFTIITFNVQAWNKTGHILISEMACEQLGNEQLEKLNQILDTVILKLQPEAKSIYNKQSYNLCKLAKLSILPDYWRQHRFKDLASALQITDSAILTTIGNQKTTDWHYRDKQTDTGKLNSVVEELIKNIKMTKSNDAKALGLIFLTHLIEDAHQPLHSMSQTINKALKLNDRGGNLYCLRSSSKHQSNTCNYSLHNYWDNGGGLLTIKAAKLKSFAKNFNSTLKYSEQSCSDLTVQKWLDENSTYKKQIYHTSANKMPTKAYQSKAQEIAKERINLASCRLSTMIKSLLQ